MIKDDLLQKQYDTSGKRDFAGHVDEGMNEIGLYEPITVLHGEDLRDLWQTAFGLTQSLMVSKIDKR